MGRQESSQPRHHHCVPHHRSRPRHRRHQSGDHSAIQGTNHELSLDLGRLNRELHTPSTRISVESWLGQVTSTTPLTRSGSPDHQGQPTRYERRSRSRNVLASPPRPHAGRADHLWRPQHVPPSQDSFSTHLPLLTTYDNKSKRRKQPSSDSSLIGEISPPREHRERCHVKVISEPKRNSRDSLQDEDDMATDASSLASHTGAAPAFTRRPRNKTREDKYDIKKPEHRKNSSKIPSQADHQPEAGKTKKKRRKVTGKNVMNNFKSDAVLNDRITTNMKPGLFNNKRMPKREPVTDLSFSEMPFPSQQEYSVSQHKGLSSSRIRERRRESRELEQISSFFSPLRTGAMQRKANSKTGRRKAVRKDEIDYRDKTTSPARQGSFGLSSTPASQTQSHCQRSYMSRCSTPSVAPEHKVYPPSSAKTTTYLTWSSSQKSLKPRQSENTEEKPTKPVKVATPESVRRALVQTGVYRDTGILSQDVLNTQNELFPETASGPLSAGNNVAGHEENSERNLSDMEKERRCSNNMSPIATPLIPLEKRWDKILPPQWKLWRPTEVRRSPVDQREEPPASNTLMYAGSPPGHNVIRESQIRPVRNSGMVQLDCHGEYGDSKPGVYSVSLTPVPASRKPIAAADYTDRDRIASRDAMPPPPIPQRQNTSPRKDDSFATQFNEIKLLRTETQIPVYSYPQVDDFNEAACDQAGLGRGFEQTIANSDSASWILQSRTPDIGNYERDKTISRLSMRSPIYEGQKTQNEASLVVPVDSTNISHMTENMAAFIARIESETETSPLLQEHYQSEQPIEDYRFSTSVMTNAHSSRSRELTASGASPLSYYQPRAR